MSKHFRVNFSFVLVMFLLMLVAAPLSVYAKEQTSSFKDVTKEHWAYFAIQKSVQEGIVQGYQDETFRPNNDVTPIEFIIMFYRVYNNELELSTDEANNWKSPYISLAEQSSWDIDTTKSTLNRGEVARFIYSVLEKNKETEASAILFMLNQGYSSGITSATVEGYGTSQLLTRAQAVTFLQNIKASVPNLEGYTPKSNEEKISEEEAKKREEQLNIETDNQNKLLENKFIESVTLRNVKIGDSTIDLVNKLGEPNRVYQNDQMSYYTYNSDYSQYALYFIKNGSVEGMYSNAQNSWSSPYVATIGTLADNITVPVPTSLSLIYYIDNHEEHTVEGILLTKASITPLSNTASYDDEIEVAKQILDLTNAFRIKHGLSPLVWHEKLSEVAYQYSVYMYKYNHFDHYSREGLSPFDRMMDEGISYRSAGENIAMGYQNAIEVTNGWINSQGHRNNMLQTGYDSLGVGVHHKYYTQNFIGY